MAKQYGIVVDIGSCIGCDVCTIACKQANNLAPSKDDVPSSREWPGWIQVHRILKGIYPDLSMHYLPIMCMHCKNPPCVEACPWDAIYQREDGVVLVKEDKCDACKDLPSGPRCIPACPYEVIQFNEEKGVVGFCTLCADRIDAGLEPACVQACEGRVFTIGDFGDPNSEVSKIVRAAGDRAFVLKPEKGASPSLWYIRPPELSLDEVTDVVEKVSG
jgi:Fe-S-cluster-containing dehydrogenase component